MLIPIGLDRNEVRRTPWISIALLVLNVAAFLLLRMGASDPNDPSSHAVFDAKADEIERFLADHPYLEVPAELRPLCTRELLDDLAKAKADSAARNETPIPMVLREQQARLNEMTRQLFAAARRGPGETYGFVPAHPDPGRAISSMFVHGGWMHLIGNLLFLFATGPFLEDVFGRFLYLGLYLSSGLVAAYSHALLFPTSEVPLVGASGAIAGVMGAFLVRLGASRIKFLCIPILFLPFLRFTFFVRAVIVLPLWFLEQWVAAGYAETSHVATWAHIGGFAFGVAFAFAIQISKLEEKVIHPGIEGEIGWQQHPALVRASTARSLGNHALARREVMKVLEADRVNVDAWTQLTEIAWESGDRAEFGRAATRLLELYLVKNEETLAKELVHSVWDRDREAAPVRFLVSGGGFLEKLGDARSALEFYKLAAKKEPADPASLRALLKSAELLSASGDRPGARAALAQALNHPACVDGWRTRIEGLLATA